MRRALAAAVVATLALSGCAGSDEPATPTEETPAASATSEAPSATESPESTPNDATEEPDDSAQVLEIEIEGDRVEPNGKRVKVTAGEPITLEVESDRVAELHVHSSPEQELSVKKGESTLSLTIKTPGIVDVEEHDSGIVIYQLEVR